MPVTLEDVAILADVSTATVSRALRGLPNVAEATRRRVVRAAELLGYVADPAARSLAAGRTNAIGVVIPTLGRWAHARMVEVITDVAAEADMDVLPLVTTTAAARRLAMPSHPFRRRVDGFIVVEAPLSAAEVAQLAEGRPVVTVGVAVEETDRVASDDRAGVVEAVAYLVDHGHRDIALLDTSGAGEDGQRLVGWREATAAAGLDARDDLVVESQPTTTGGAAAMGLLLDAPGRPTAIVAASDEMALGALEVARSRGLRVPEDLSVIGFDDQPVAQYIGLTTIRRDVAAVARHAARWVVTDVASMGDRSPAARRDPGSVRTRVVDTTLVVRASTGPVPLIAHGDGG